MSHLEIVQKFSSTLAPQEILDRAKRIFKTGEYKIEVNAYEHDQYIYKVKSDNHRDWYSVVVNGVKAGKPKAQCSCPYGQKQLCKHGIAMFYAVASLLDDKNFKDGYDQSSIVLEIFKGISPTLLDKVSFTSKKERGIKIVASKAITQIKDEPRSVSFEVIEGKRKFVVFFERKNLKNLNTSCACAEQDSEICTHKYAVLFHLLTKKKEPFFFDKFLDLDEEKNKLLGEYGFSLKDNIKDKFDFIVDNGKVELVRLDTGLRKISKHNGFGAGVYHFPEAKPSLMAIDEGPMTVPQSDVIVTVRFGKNENSNLEQYIKPVAVERNKSGKGIKTVLSDRHSHALFTNTTPELKQLLALNRKLNSDIIIGNFKKKFNTNFSNNEQEFFHYLHLLYKAFSPMVPLLQDFELYLTDEDYLVTSRKDLIAQVNISEKRLNMRFKVVEESDLFVLETIFFIEGNPGDIVSLASQGDSEDEEFDDWDYNDNEGADLTLDMFFFRRGNILHFHGTAEHAAKLLMFSENPVIKIHKSDEEGFYRQFVFPLSKQYNIEMKTKKKIKKLSATLPRPKLYLKELDKFILFQPTICYEQKEVELFDKELILVPGEKHILQYERDDRFENDIKQFLVSLHPEFAKQQEKSFFYLNFQQLLKSQWLFEAIPSILEKGIEVFGQENFQQLKIYNYSKPVVNIKSSSGIDWFDVNVEISYDGQKIKLKDVQKAFLRGDKFVKLGNGQLAILPEMWLKRLEGALKMGEVKGDQIKLSKLHFSLVDSLFSELNEEKIVKELSEKKKKLLEYSAIAQTMPPVPQQVSLRDYQVASFHWLNFLDEFNWGGCLADDMGLGKTLQMITFLKHQSVLYPNVPNLIVMPTTLIYNWVQETEKFFPELKFLVLYGTQRDKNTEMFSTYNFIFTSYSVLLRDIEFLKDYKFNYVVLDESQAIKNISAQRYKAVRLLKARNRLAMTGTPIENNTFDLYAQMSFLNPGLLGAAEFFKEEFSNPIDKKADNEKAAMLRKIISPFVLRRTKEQVAKELPEKTEMTMYCEMEEEQRKVYTAFKEKYRDQVLNKIAEEGLEKSTIVILDALLKLRQICNSPALLNTNEDYGNESIKIKELMRHIEEKTGDHKILVFSQFVKMLKLIEKELKSRKIGYEYLDGSSKDRIEIVDRFKCDNGCRVFLISLKAGGVGINLTEADYVYLVDPWWNPAIENQAIDRTHRIGQNKKVFAYRMICKDTIEEKVLMLQERKKKVANELIQTEASFIKQLDKEGIVNLFK